MFLIGWWGQEVKQQSIFVHTTTIPAELYPFVSVQIINWSNKTPEMSERLKLI